MSAPLKLLPKAVPTGPGSTNEILGKRGEKVLVNKGKVWIRVK